MQFGLRNIIQLYCVASCIINVSYINHYLSHGNNVYSCLLDARKSFYRIH